MAEELAAANDAYTRFCEDHQWESAELYVAFLEGWKACSDSGALADAWDEGRSAHGLWAVCPDCLGHGCETCTVVNPYRRQP